MENKNEEQLSIYEGSGKFTFIHTTIFQCIKFWFITNLTGGHKPIDDMHRYLNKK